MNKYPIRVSTKAIIIENGCLLCNEHKYAGKLFYTLPGGGQEFGETLFEAVIRECAEEIGALVEPLHVVFIRDYIRRNHEPSRPHDTFHQMEVMILCRLVPGSRPGLGPSPDNHQIGAAWIALEELPRVTLYPRHFAPVLIDWAAGKPVEVYLGDMG